MNSYSLPDMDALFIDYKAGFGGKYGVQNDRVDKCAVGWEHKENLTKHESQKGKNKKLWNM